MTRPPIQTRIVAGLKSAVATALYATGLLHLAIRVRLRGNAVVLTYHRVLPARERALTWSHPGIIVAPETFERHMQVLTRLFRPQPVDRFLTTLHEGRPFEPGACLVTFDDGWRDTFEHAWPILRRHAVPALVFLPVQFIGSSRVFWQEHLGELLHAAWHRRREGALDRPLAEAIEAAGLQAVLDLPADRVREGVIAAVRGLKLTEAAGMGAAARLEALTGQPPSPVDRFMTWPDARQMGENGVSFGAHGTTHRQLTQLADAEVDEEVSTARRQLRRELGIEAPGFCYPSGAWNASVVDRIRAHGFTAAFSTARGPVRPGDPAFALQRVNIHQDVTRTVPLFLTRLLGVF